MSTTKSIRLFPIRGKVQQYAWGGPSYIPEMLGFAPEQGKTYAEYWMGAHVNAPAQVQLPQGGEQPLDALLAQDPAAYLGAPTAERFGALPYLFKVLDVKDMLSIQVHPTKAEAEKGFARENEQGIPLTASHRNYKDDNHKPEIMVALGEFWLLHGFLPEDKLRAVLDEVPEFATLQPIFEQGGYYGLYEYVMQLPQAEVDRMLSPLMARVLPLYQQGKLAKIDPAYWAARSTEMQGMDASVLDRGIFSIYFFNIMRVEEGQAVFQDAGIPHAYMEGQNIELMANSDNVLRGGLTPKHVDVPELLKHTLFEAVHPQVLEGEVSAQNPTERIYHSPAPDFELSRISLQAGERYVHTAASAEILLLLKGEASVSGSAQLQLAQGDTALALAGEQYEVTTTSQALIFKASVPVNI